ncbi:MAG: fatty acid desaturase [Gemmatimonadota bacterium]
MSVAVLRHSSRDALLIVLAGAYAVLLVTAFSPLLVAVGIWWIANTVSHNFIHLPFFRDRRLNLVFSAYLSLLLGVPQTLWRDRHIAHHADRPCQVRWSAQLSAELALVITAWLALAIATPDKFVPFGIGWLTAMVLCWLQGHYEHVRGTVSHYGSLYNFAFFNDGYHVEHHARPGLHWTVLPHTANARAQQSAWPAVLRWLEVVHLNTLERLVLRSTLLQRFVVDRHARAFAPLIAALPPVRSVAIVGGGLFPRTALVLRRLLPAAQLSVIDMSAESIRCARPFIEGEVTWIQAAYSPQLCDGADLVIVPLAFSGDRARFYSHPPAPAVLVHDWIWHRIGDGCVVSLPLLKRINLVRA